MTELHQLVRKAYTIYGPTLGIQSVKIPVEKYTNVFKTLKNFHFFLKGEASPPATWRERQTLINEQKISHCCPCKGGYYDYLQNKMYTTLEEWYNEVKDGVYGDSPVPPFEEAIAYGRRSPSQICFQMNYEDLIAKLRELVQVNTFEKKSDSWDTLFENYPDRISEKGLRLYYKHPELNTMICTRLLNRKLHYTWTPDKPRYEVAVMNSKPDQPVWRYATSISELHPSLSIEDIYVEQNKLFDGYIFPQRALIPISQI